MPIIPTVGNGIENWDRFPPPSGLGAVWHFEEITDRTHARTLQGEQRMTRVFQVITSSPLVGSTTVIAFDQIRTPFPPPMVGSEFNGKPQRRVPQAGDWYVELDAQWNVVHSNPHVVCVDVRAEQTNPDDLTVWTVTANYAGEDDPLAEPADVDVVRVPYQKALLEDLDGKAVRNSAGDPFEAGLLVDRHRFKLVIQKNILSYNPFVWETYQDSVNQFALVIPKLPPGIPAGKGKLTHEATRMRRSIPSSWFPNRPAASRSARARSLRSATSARRLAIMTLLVPGAANQSSTRRCRSASALSAVMMRPLFP